MADVLDTTVTKSAEPEATPAAETTPTGQEPEGNQSKPESKFLQRLGKLLGIGGDGEDDGDGAAKSKEDGKADPPPKDGQTYTEADLQARIDAAKAQWQAEQEEQARLAKLSPEELEAFGKSFARRAEERYPIKTQLSYGDKNSRLRETDRAFLV